MEGWLSDGDWKRLYNSLRPECSQIEFRESVPQEGVLERYKLHELTKLSAQLREILLEKGRLMDAAAHRWGKRKSEIIARIREVATVPRIPVEVRAPAQPQEKNVCRPLAYTTVPSVTASLPGNNFLPRCLVNGPLSSMPPVDPTMTFSPQPVQRPTNKLQTLVNSPYQSPFAPISAELTRMVLHNVTVVTNVDIGASDVALLRQHRKRMLLIPVTSAGLPNVWPKGKEMFVYVNGEAVTTSWKRCWPVKKHDLRRSFLPLDISMWVKSNTTQRVQIDLFVREYVSSVAVVLVDVVPDGDVVERFLKSRTDTTALLRGYDAAMKVLCDDDADVEAAAPSVLLKCPISQCRITIPIRGVRCLHLQPIDLLSYLKACHIGCYWNCPLCDAVLTESDVIIDTFITEALNSTATRIQLNRSDSPAGPPYYWKGDDNDKVALSPLSCELDGTLVEASGVLVPLPKRIRREGSSSETPIIV